MRMMNVCGKALVAGVMVAFCLVGKAQQKEVHGATDSAQGNVGSAEIASANTKDSQAVPAEEASKAKAQRVIQGKVVDAKTGKPIPKFTVLVSPPVRDYGTDPRSTDFTITATREFISEAGQFVLAEIAGDACALVVKAEGYVHGIVWDYVLRGPKRGRSSQLWTEEPLVFELQPGGRIHGRVVDADSQKSIPGAMVVLNDPMGDAAPHKLPGFRVEGRLAETKTDDSGAFALEGIAFGRHWLRVTHPYFLPKAVKGVTLNPDQREVTQEISLAPGAGVSGVVLNGERAIRDLGTSKPIEGVTVIASVKGKLAPFQAHLPIGRATTDKEGHYEITSLTEGPCNVCAYVAWPGLIRILGCAKDVALRRGTITEVNLRPTTDGATLIVKASAKWPLLLFLATSPAGEKAYGLVHPEDGRILSLGIDCIALGMFFLKPPSGEKPPYGVRLPGFLSKGLGEVSEKELVDRACKLENVPAGTYYVHALAMSELKVSGAPGHLIGGAKVTLTAGETREVIIDLESAAKHPRKPILDIPGDI